MASPTRFPGGVTNVASTDPLGQLGMPDPTRFHTYFDDFNAYKATDWVITTTEAGASSATEAASAADGGVLVITNDAASGDLDNLQLSMDGGTTVGPTFLAQSGKKLFFKARAKLTDGNSSISAVGFFLGLASADTSLVATAPTHSLSFRKSDGATAIQCRSTITGTSQSTTTSAVMVNDTWHTFGIYFDGKITAGSEPHVFFYFDGALIDSKTVSAISTAVMAPSFAITNGAAFASVLSIDYILVARER